MVFTFDELKAGTSTGTGTGTGAGTGTECNTGNKAVAYLAHHIYNLGFRPYMLLIHCKAPNKTMAEPIGILPTP